MSRNPVRLFLFIAAATLLFGSVAFGQAPPREPATPPLPATPAETPRPLVPERLSWPEIAARISGHETVRQALIARNMAASLLASAEGWKGPRLGVAPTLQMGDPEGRMEPVQTGLSADLQIPFGTTEEERERRISAGEKLLAGDAELAAAYGRAYTELFAAYSASYLAQKAAETWEKEVEYARLKAESARQKVARGLLPVAEQTDAESDLQGAAEKLLQARLEQRLAWFNLAYQGGIVTPRTGQGIGAGRGPGESYGAVPVFTAPDPVVRDTPQPSRLMVLARANLPEIVAQRQKVEAARRSLSYRRTLDFDVLPKITYATPDSSLSLGFSTGTGTLTAGAFLPLYTLDWKTGTGQVLDHSLTLSLGVNVAVAAAAADDRAALAGAVELEERRLHVLEEMSDLQIRSRYAALLKARDSQAEAERAVRAAVETSAVAGTRKALGLSSPEDEAAAAVLTARADYNREKARIDAAGAYLALIGAANAWTAAGIGFPAPTK